MNKHQEIMTLKKMGAEAFFNGKSSASAQNAEAVSYMFSSEKKTSTLIDMLDAYLRGWTVASLGHDASDDFPSAKQLKEIMSFEG